MQGTWTATAFLGVRLWQGAELYFDPEIAQGFGLNGTLGVAGFPDGEAQRGGAAFPKIRPQRYYIKQTFGLGGEQEDVADGPNQLAGKRDVDRVTLIVGRFAMGDFFDNNAYAHDPRADFMNWAMWESAAYDFPADQPGYTRGAVVEFNRKDWAVRAALVEVPSAAQQRRAHLQDRGHGRRIRGAPHPVRPARQVAAGRIRQQRQYRQLPTGAGDRGGRPDAGHQRRDDEYPAHQPQIRLLRQPRTADRQGFRPVRALELERRPDQILSFTDIDRSLSGGISVKGSYWGRPNDTVGIGGAINGLSAAHRDFLAAGGLGPLIGDGQLNYRPEQILEAYYAYRSARTSRSPPTINSSQIPPITPIAGRSRCSRAACMASSDSKAFSGEVATVRVKKTRQIANRRP